MDDGNIILLACLLENEILQVQVVTGTVSFVSF